MSLSYDNASIENGRYEFTRNGATSVSYGGQTTRLHMVNEIYSLLNKASNLEDDQLVNMFKNNEDAQWLMDELKDSGKKLSNKTAKSKHQTKIVGFIEHYLNKFTSIHTLN